MLEKSCQCTGVCIHSSLNALQTGAETHRNVLILPAAGMTVMGPQTSLCSGEISYLCHDADAHIVLQQKMRVMKNHADTLLDNILNHPNLTEPQITQMPLSQKEDLRRRVKVADDVSLTPLPPCLHPCLHVWVRCIHSNKPCDSS